jgi:hypothetical protein
MERVGGVQGLLLWARWRTDLRRRVWFLLLLLPLLVLEGPWRLRPLLLLLLLAGQVPPGPAGLQTLPGWLAPGWGQEVRVCCCCQARAAAAVRRCGRCLGCSWAQPRAGSCWLLLPREQVQGVVGLYQGWKPPLVRAGCAAPFPRCRHHHVAALAASHRLEAQCWGCQPLQ